MSFNLVRHDFFQLNSFTLFLLHPPRLIQRNRLPLLLPTTFGKENCQLFAKDFLHFSIPQSAMILTSPKNVTTVPLLVTSTNERLLCQLRHYCSYMSFVTSTSGVDFCASYDICKGQLKEDVILYILPTLFTKCISKTTTSGPVSDLKLDPRPTATTRAKYEKQFLSPP